ncbi:MAG: hypothetical protein A2503_12450 [Burkholderiales bacterium RIFOXYD12_FULL_59_19]|nr:MAG: hypothetical protein A2503_12450 [Burkholderiales bacterium RIFOXYD12_FULL_59_19]
MIKWFSLTILFKLVLLTGSAYENDTLPQSATRRFENDATPLLYKCKNIHLIIKVKGNRDEGCNIWNLGQ